MTYLLDIVKETAKTTGISEKYVYAAIMQESHGQFSWGDGKIPILVERHKVYKYYKKKYGLRAARRAYKLNPDICNPTSGGYGKYRDQYNRLAKAIDICGAEIAHLGTSFGAFQIMGFNHSACGFESAVEMANAMHAGSEKDQARAQIVAWHTFISQGKGAALKALRAGNLKQYAKLYNGKAYAINQYDTKLARLAAMYENNIV